MPRFTLIPFDQINRAALRLVLFATQGAAVTFVRDTLALTPNESGEYAAFRTDQDGIAALRQAVCRVAGTPRTPHRKAGETYKSTRGKNKGKTVTAAYDTYRTFTVAEYAAAANKLGIQLVEDPGTLTSHTNDKGRTINVMSYVIRKAQS